MKNLTRAKEAGAEIFDALVGAGILPADGASEQGDVDSLALFAGNGHATDDADSAPAVDPA
jgi:hypothetical protein